MASAAQAPDFPSRLTEEIARDRSTLDSLNHTEFTKGDAANIQTALADAEKHIQAKRPLIALEMLSSATPGTLGLKAAAAGWGQNGKGIEVLEADWKAAGEAMERDKKKFPTRAPAGQPMFVRAVAELSMGQVNENYAAAVDYGKVAGIQFGAYYLGRSQGHLAFALYSSGLASGENRKPFALPDLAEKIAALDKTIVASYARPGSTQFHPQYIAANSSIKLSRELNAAGWRTGALVVLMRAVYSFGQIETKPPAVSELPALKAEADKIAAQIAADKRDQSIAEQYLQKVYVALEIGAGTEQAAEGQRHRAALLLHYVLPKYFELIEGAK